MDPGRTTLGPLRSIITYPRVPKKAFDMSGRRVTAIALIASLVACSQDDQVAFQPEPAAEVTKEIGPEGGTISTSAGLSVHIPEGALDAPTTITLKPVADRTPGGPFHGTIIPGTGYELGPKGLRFSKPVQVEMMFHRPASGRPNTFLGAVPGGGAAVSSNSSTDDLLDLLMLGGLIDDSGDIDWTSLTNHFDMVFDPNDSGAVFTSHPSWATGYIGAAITPGLTIGRDFGDQTTGMRPSLTGATAPVHYVLRCGILEEKSCIGTGPEAPIRVFADSEILERYPETKAVILDAVAMIKLDPARKMIEGMISIESSFRAKLAAAITSKDISVQLTTGSDTSGGDPVATSYTIDGDQITFDTSDGPRTLRFTATEQFLFLVTPSVEIELKDRDGTKRKHAVSALIRLDRI